MSTWHRFLDLNQTVILFVYGQVFFVLGLAIVWQSRRHSRLDLARSLGWLGAFGLIHAVHEWGDVFIPIQTAFLDEAWIEALLLLQVILLMISFACLFQFGTETLILTSPHTRWMRAIPGLLLMVWITGFLWISQVLRWDAGRVVIYAHVWSRYLLGLPGALVAALALRQQARERNQLQEFHRITRAFQVASLALGAYSIVGGLLVPPAPFFPANVLNSDVVFQHLGVPVQVLRSLAGLVLTVGMVRGLDIFDMEIDRRIEEMEQAQLLLSERQRISRELHDGAIQTVYTAGLIAESIRAKMGDEEPLAGRMDQVISALHHSVADLRQFVVELEPRPSVTNLVEELHALTQDPYLQSLVDVEAEISLDTDDQLSPVRAMHVLAIVKEALSNIVRHAQARHVWVIARGNDSHLQVTVADDGVGMSAKQAPGFGLRNMRDRSRLLGGTLQIEQRSPRGTQIDLTVPWIDNR